MDSAPIILAEMRDARPPPGTLPGVAESQAINRGESIDVNVSLLVWGITVAAILILVVLDFVVGRRPHEVKFKEAAAWSTFYIAVAVAFGVYVWTSSGGDFATQYFSAYLVEKSLSVDNLFVFAIILTQFAVPSIYLQRVLLIGVVLALVLRAIFIAVGAAALSAFSFTFVIFGALLIWTGIQLFRHRNQDPDPKENIAVRWTRRWIPVTPDFHGTRLFIKENGVRMATPMLLVLIAIASTDLLFALDSIPATFGVTQEPYLVFTANAAALLGLRALYFLVHGLLDRLVFLSAGLALILVFIGAKLMLTFAHETWPTVPKVPTLWSLAVIGVILAVSVAASVVAVRRNPELRGHAGTLRSQGAPNDSEDQV